MPQLALYSQERRTLNLYWNEYHQWQYQLWNLRLPYPQLWPEKKWCKHCQSNDLQEWLTGLFSESVEQGNRLRHLYFLMLIRMICYEVVKQKLGLIGDYKWDGQITCNSTPKINYLWSSRIFFPIVHGIVYWLRFASLPGSFRCNSRSYSPQSSCWKVFLHDGSIP